MSLSRENGLPNSAAASAQSSSFGMEDMSFGLAALSLREADAQQRSGADATDAIGRAERFVDEVLRRDLSKAEGERQKLRQRRNDLEKLLSEIALLASIRDTEHESASSLGPMGHNNIKQQQTSSSPSQFSEATPAAAAASSSSGDATLPPSPSAATFLPTPQSVCPADRNPLLDIPSMVNLGCEVYAAATIYDGSRPFIDVGLGFFIQMTLEEAAAFIPKKIKITELAMVQWDEKIARIKAHIRMFLESLSFIYSAATSGGDLPFEPQLSK